MQSFNSTMSDYDFIFPIRLLGEKEEKDSIFLKYKGQLLSQNVEGDDIKILSLNKTINDKMIRFQIRDYTHHHSKMKSDDAYWAIVDVTSKQRFIDFSDFVTQVSKLKGFDPTIILLGIKSDLVQDRKTLSEELEQVVKNHHITYVEVRTDANERFFNELLELTAKEIFSKINEKFYGKNLNLMSKPQKPERNIQTEEQEQKRCCRSKA